METGSCVAESANFTLVLSVILQESMCDLKQNYLGQRQTSTGVQLNLQDLRESE